MRNNMGVATDSLSRTRWAIINVWRPIRPIRRDPFAMCDAKTVTEADLVQVEAVLPPQGSGTFENVSKGGFSTWCCKSNPNHRWYCKSHSLRITFMSGRVGLVTEAQNTSKR